VAPEKRRASVLVEGSLLLTVFFFGTNFTAVKYVVESVPPILFAASRFTLAGLLLLPVALISGPKGRLARGDLLPMIGLGVVGVTVTQVGAAQGLRRPRRRPLPRRGGCDRLR
jgi:drug/metabolite transporter (DMT)-like permease